MVVEEVLHNILRKFNTNAKKTFSCSQVDSSLTVKSNVRERYVHKPSQIFGGKYTTWKYLTRLEVNGTGKHSSFLQYGHKYGCKNFVSIGPFAVYTHK